MQYYQLQTIALNTPVFSVAHHSSSFFTFKFFIFTSWNDPQTLGDVFHPSCLAPYVLFSECFRQHLSILQFSRVQLMEGVVLSNGCLKVLKKIAFTRASRLECGGWFNSKDLGLMLSVRKQAHYVFVRDEKLNTSFSFGHRAITSVDCQYPRSAYLALTWSLLYNRK